MQGDTGPSTTKQKKESQMTNLAISLLLLGTLTLCMAEEFSVKEQIEAIQNTPQEKKVKLMNQLKEHMATMSPEERQQVMQELHIQMRSAQGDEHAQDEQAREMTHERQEQMREHAQEMQMETHREMQHNQERSQREAGEQYKQEHGGMVEHDIPTTLSTEMENFMKIQHY